ncbi:MAG: DUF1446 domain-containing protein [Planctomycetota bacterium]|jgi:hypothetical protein|nr:DUF1446 domain-containing protein [Planctomycetota bacterium]
MRDHVCVANGQGFWGDSILGPVRLVREGPLDYLALDYLAEVTMSIMQKLKSRDPSAGYATDFLRMLDRILPELREKGTRVIANAGGVNPQGCMEAVLDLARQKSVTGLGVGIIEGDDILEQLPQLVEQGEPFENMDTGEPLDAIVDRITSANVYIGSRPVADCLAAGADIVIGGRITDPALVTGPLVHEFGWSDQDYDKLAAATVAGHISECGAQCTGGNFTAWREIPEMARIGYPIIDAKPDGSFCVTKHANTGGLVDRRTVTSQLLYEMGDPSRYLGPDCIADFATIQMEEEATNRVRISGVRGHAPTDTYKVSISYFNGYKAVGQLTVAGPEAVAKAQLCAEIVFDRLALDGVEFEDSEKTVELIGSGVCHEGIVPLSDPPEVVLRIGVRHPDKGKVNRFGMEIVPLVTSGPPGVTGFAGGRPKATEVISFWPALISKDKLAPTVRVEKV